MTVPRITAACAPLAFAILAWVLVWTAGLPVDEAKWATLAVFSAFMPTAWMAPGGWRRRAAEWSLLPVALVLVMAGGAGMRQMLMPPLLILAAWSVVWPALDRVPQATRCILLGMLGLSARCAVGGGLAGHGLATMALVLLASAAAPWAAARSAGRWAGATALLVSVAPLPRHTSIAAFVVAVALVVAVLPISQRVRRLPWRGWLPGAGGAVLLVSALAPWGGLDLHGALPEASIVTLGALLMVIVVARWLPPAVAGVAWFAVAGLCGPVLAPPPDRGSFTVTAEWPERSLPEARGSDYVVDLAIARGGALATGTPVATLSWGEESIVFRAGEDAVEWSVERPLEPPTVAHSLPRLSVRRPGVSDGQGFWSVSGRNVITVPEGVVPVLRRSELLPEQVNVVVPTSGPSRITSPRAWAFASWLWATAAVVLLLQLISGTWRNLCAVMPWALLGAGAVALRMPVEPLRLISERYGIDLCLLALLAAWLPAAWRWGRRRRVFVAVVTLLAPLALATPMLTPPLYGDEPFHLMVLDSMAEDGDLDLTNNIDDPEHGYQKLFQTDEGLHHSPVLATLLLPGYLLGGRAGALMVLALAGAALVALLARRACGLGLPPSRGPFLVAGLTLTYPVATYSTQIWPEIIGALAVAAALLAVSARPQGRAVATVAAVVATAVKTRLALVTVPIAAAAWFGRGRRLLGAVVLGIAVAASLAVGWVFMGHPFGAYRRLHHLLPDGLAQPVTVVCGLLFDAAGGLLFTAPLALVALAGVATLWRIGGTGERALLLGCGATVAALLHSLEWYGGGSPPARYLVTLVPAAALAAAVLLSCARPWRWLGVLVLPPSVLAWWVLLTRPHLSINPGDGGYWLADALARRFQAEARVFFPSFLTPGTATIVVPIVVIGLALCLWAVARARPALIRRLAAASAAVWLLAAAALVAAVNLRADKVVQVEAPQVRRRGGEPHPPEGAFSRFTDVNGWRLYDGHQVVVPLHLPANAELELHGWLLGNARNGAELELSWDGGAAERLAVRGRARHARIALPSPPGPGRHRLSLKLHSPPYGAAVLDRIEVINAHD